MNFIRLLAKSSRTPDQPQARETLPGHLHDVTQTAQALVNSFGERYLEALSLRGTFDLKTLESALVRAAALHDLGKANHQFQHAVRREAHWPQALRHEWVSVWLLLQNPETDGWLFKDCPETVRLAALFAVLGHHLKAEDGNSISIRPGSGDTKVILLCDHPDFRACLEAVRDALHTDYPPSFPQNKIDLIDRPLGALRNWLPEAIGWHDDANPEMRRFVGLIKALMISGDVAGSAVPKEGKDPKRWTEKVLSRVCEETELQTIAHTNLKGKPLRPFQIKVEQSESRVTFVRAGCGSGKTVAAYLWAGRRAKGRKLFICYPTTGTATEGYRDYIIPSEMSAEAALLHSRSEVDLEAVLEARDGDEGDDLEGPLRIESLRAWDVPLVVCTTDLVLGLMQNNRRSLFSFPALADGAFVFDEIHQYDERLFGALLGFLEAFQGAPVLLMTASLPKPRLEAIQKVLERHGEVLHIVEGPVDLEHIKRYELKGPFAEPPWDLVTKTMAESGKVLWVANTISRARGFAEEAQKRGLKPLPYHSCYRYCDRVEHHNRVVQAFKEESPGPALAVTTQVCEVSLDLSADLLVSDLAPVPALIQRLGRLNRRVTAEKPRRACPAIFLEPKGTFPYDKEEFDVKAVKNWLGGLAGKEVSQADLAMAFEKGFGEGTVPRVKSAWLDGGPFSWPSPLRESSASIPVLRAEDEPYCLDDKGRPVSKEIARYAIPMPLGPVKEEIKAWKRLSFVFVTREGRIEYSKEWGAKWAHV